MRHILLHPRLRSTIPRLPKTDLCNRSWTRYRCQVHRPSTCLEATSPVSRGINSALFSTSRSQASAKAPPKAASRKGPPERILIYYGGTGRTIFLGAVRVTTIILFGAACTMAYQLSYTEDYSWIVAPLVLGGAIPMIFVAYTSAPHVSFVHLALPAFARRSREAALNYVKDLPPTANLFITTMRFNTMPRQTPVRLGELVGDKNMLRPVSFRHTNPAARQWWMHKAPTQFYTAGTSKPGRQSQAYYPEFWPRIFERIQGKSGKTVSR